MSMKININFQKPLTDEENAILMHLNDEHIPAKIPDENIRELYERNLRLVLQYMKKINMNNLDSDDIFSLGAYGLLKAIINFNPAKRNKLSSFCIPCIRNEILMYIRKEDKHKHLLHLEDIITESDDGNSMTIMDTLSDESSDYNLADTVINNSTLREALPKLPERQRLVIYYRYYRGYTQVEIAKMLGLSRSSISKTEKDALVNLRKHF